MAANRIVQREIVLRDGGSGYWITVDPQDPRFPDKFVPSRVSLYQQALLMVLANRRWTVRDETSIGLVNFDGTAKHFASRQPWANNDYAPPSTVVTALSPLTEPTFYDAKLLSE